MKRLGALALLLLTVIAVQAGMMDYMTSPAGVYRSDKFENRIRTSEVADFRKDNSFLWTTTVSYPLSVDGVPIRPDSVTEIRGTWKASRGKVTLTWVTKDAGEGTMLLEIDDGDLVYGDLRLVRKK